MEGRRASSPTGSPPAALRWPLLCAFLLLLPLPSCGDEAPPGPGGEWCRVWGPPGRAFRCPRRRDGAGAGFCCGTCSFPYCCASREGRLDQRRCPGLEPPGGRPTQAPRNHPPAEGAAASRWTVFSCFISFLVGITLVLSVRHCRERYGTRLRSCWDHTVTRVWGRCRDEPPEVFQTGVYYLPQVPDPVLHPPPPNVTILAPSAEHPEEKWACSPAALVGFFQSGSGEAAEGEAAASAPVHRHVLSQASDLPSERETAV